MKNIIIIRFLIILVAILTVLSCKTNDHKNEYFPEPISNGGWRGFIPPNSSPSKTQKLDIVTKTGLDWDILNKAWNYDMDIIGTKDVWPRDSRKSLLVIRHGWIAFERYYSDNGIYNKESRVRFASGTKTLIGVSFAKLFSQGIFKPTDYVYQYLPESWVKGEPARKKIQLRHVLTMSSGLEPYDGPYDTATYAKIIKNLAVITDPGTQWFYNTGALDLMNYILYDISGKTVESFLNSEILLPIGGSGVYVEPRHKFEGHGFCSSYAITPRDYARIGYLFLKHGRWKDKQIIDRDIASLVTSLPSWLLKASAGSSDISEPNKNYAYTFWLNKTGGVVPALPTDAFMASGGNHKMIVIPSLDMIIVRYGNYTHDHNEVNQVYNIIRQAVTDVPVASDRIVSGTIIPLSKSVKTPDTATFTPISNFKNIPSVLPLEIEAENGVCVKPMRVEADNTETPSIQFAWVPNEHHPNYDTPGGPGSVAMAFHIPESGKYNIWIRTIAPDSHSDSYFLSMDGQIIDRPWNIEPVPQSEDWQWNEIRHAMNIGAGNHVLEFRHRESGIKLDKIIITSDRNLKIK